MKEICPYYRGRDKCMKVCISRTQKTVHHRDVQVLKELYVIKFGIYKEIGPRELSQIILRSLLGRAGVTVIWVSPRFEHPHSQNPSDMGIPCNSNPNPNPNR